MQVGNVLPFNWNTRGFKCFYCDKLFSNYIDLKDHTQKHTVDIRTYVFRNVIMKDIPIKIDISNIACSVCEIQVHDIDDLIAHINSKHEQNYDTEVRDCFFSLTSNQDKINCALCKDKHDNMSSLMAHMYKMHITHESICQNCGLSFKDELRLKRHFANSHVGYKCKICGRVFGAFHKMVKHKQEIHRIERKIICNMCSKVFKSPYQVKVHLGKVHNVEKFLIKCGHCPKICNTKGAMVLHVQSVHTVARFQCDICEYKTNVKWLLTLHKRRHDEDKNYTCNLCERCFRRSSNLRTHMKVHSGAFGRVCRFCRRGFTDEGTLKKHSIDLHSGIS